jgi:hypothetical protein
MNLFYYNRFLSFKQNIRDEIANEFAIKSKLLEDIALYYNNINHDNSMEAHIDLDYAIIHYKEELDRHDELERWIMSLSDM